MLKILLPKAEPKSSAAATRSRSPSRMRITPEHGAAVERVDA